MVDITPLVPAGHQIIQDYGGGGFRIGGGRHEGSVLVFPTRTLAWPVSAMAELTLDSLAPVTAPEVDVKILLIGCGREMALPAADLRHALAGRGIAVETMETGAACRTFNVLVGEERAVAAALIALA